MNAVGLGVDVGQALGRCPPSEAVGAARLHGKPHVLLHRQPAEQIGDLERTPDTGARNVLGLEASDRPTPDGDEAFVRREHAGHQVECRGLAGAVWADQCMQRAVLHDDIGIRDGADAAEAFRKLARDEHGAVRRFAVGERSRQRCVLRNLAARHCGGFIDAFAERRQHTLGDADQPGR